MTLLFRFEPKAGLVFTYGILHFEYEALTQSKFSPKSEFSGFAIAGACDRAGNAMRSTLEDLDVDIITPQLEAVTITATSPGSARPARAD